MKVLTEKMNIFYGFIVTVMSAVFGKYWYLFFGFLMFNIIDYATGWIYGKYYANSLSSSVGAKGVLKKVSYWIIIAIAFYISFAFRKMGEVIGITLDFMILFGWFTLATYMINEVRSIIENLVKMDVKVPEFLTKGLDIAEKLTKDRAKGGEER
ncbi:MAG: phage holin family protein [Agathobacter sp.]|nr:phage holin family protein [Agathobacter sp.]